MTTVDSGMPTGAGLDPHHAGLVCVVGVGDTDYRVDYQAARAKAADYVPPTAESLGKKAFDRALADSGLIPADVDGLVVSFLYGGPPPEDFAKTLGVTPRHLTKARGMMPFLDGVEALVSGKCEVIALVHSLPSRASGRQYGGATYQGDGRDSYYYYHPWGWSAQAAHWAMMFSYYQGKYGATEADLASVPLLLRQNAMRNDNAIMRDPLTVEDYLASRYIVAPMHLFDMCLVNDGAVCLILTRTERAVGMPHTPVVVAGWGNEAVHESKMAHMVKERLRPQMQSAGGEALRMAGLTTADIDHFEGYDAASIHLINQVEGYGFVKPGEGLDFCKDGQMALGGALPTNTGGGMLSEAYLQGWNLMVECVRQLRHEAGVRQVEGAQTSMFSFATTESAHPIIFRRGA